MTEAEDVGAGSRTVLSALESIDLPCDSINRRLRTMSATSDNVQVKVLFLRFILLEDATPSVDPVYLATTSIPEYDFSLLVLAALGDG